MTITYNYPTTTYEGKIQEVQDLQSIFRVV